ncbi:adenylosuccinate lyase [Candidatus Micrarchaeota archaeon]|nr:adenylosuccinate lyase [Candidatus Micrarchaeota archaeon]
MANPNILSERYATKEINAIFSEEGKIIAERELWIAVMKAQRQLGADIPAADIAKYERAVRKIDLQRITQIESKTKHDVKARIEAFVEAAGAKEHIHKGMTSRDLTDNVEQVQIKKASKIIFGKYISILRHMAERSAEYRNIVLTARTHHQPAQPTLLGRRFAMWAEELYLHAGDFERRLGEYPLRGIKGPAGTQFDMLNLLGSEKKVRKLEEKIAKQLGFSKVLEATGQVYPRSLDYSLISGLSRLASACENFAKGMRLMSGFELVTEGFRKGQVGSSAMPHKMNTRSSERICGFAELLKMHADGASRLSGDQWEEGDVSCSVVRRVIIPDSLYASDGLCETTLTVLNGMGAYPEMAGQELERYLPFLATTEIMMAAVKKGIGRERAHKIIKRYAVSEALKMRQGGKSPEIAKRLSRDPEFQKAGISEDEINRILQEKAHFTGLAEKQIKSVNAKISNMTKKYRKEAKYEPAAIL